MATTISNGASEHEEPDADCQIEQPLFRPARQRQRPARDGDGRLAVEIADAERAIFGELRHDDLAAHVRALEQQRPGRAALRRAGDHHPIETRHRLAELIEHHRIAQIRAQAETGGGADGRAQARK